MKHALLFVIFLTAGFVLGKWKPNHHKPEHPRFEVPPDNEQVLLSASNRECFSIDGNPKVLLFNLTDDEWALMKKYRKPSTSGWFYVSKPASATTSVVQ